MQPSFVNPGPRLWEINGVMNGRLHTHHVREVVGTLSVKFVVEGYGRWRTEGREFGLDGSSVLVLNHGQPYTLHIDSPDPTETFCLFFRPGFAEGVAQAFRARLDDDPTPPALVFPSRLEPDADALVGRLLTFRRAVQGPAFGEPDAAEDAFIDFAEAIVDLRQRQAIERSRVPVTASYRDEVYLRLSRARDAMVANLRSPLALPEVSREAFLSPFHFHRLYRQTFGETPQQFTTRLRVAQATKMLASGDWSAVEVCAELGFTSYASFSHLIARATGRRPRDFTREAQDPTSATLRATA